MGNYTFGNIQNFKVSMILIYYAINLQQDK